MSEFRRSAWASMLAVVAIAAMAACGGGDAEVAVRPASVPVEIVPPTLAEGTLTLTEDATAKKAFTTAGDQALVADGRLWAVRQGERLVATLQVSTMKPKVDLAIEEDRESVIRNIFPGTSQRITVGDVPVVQSTSSDKKTVYLWFGKEVFQVLQIKGSKIDPEQMLAELVQFQQASPAWEPVPTAADADADADSGDEEFEDEYEEE